MSGYRKMMPLFYSRHHIPSRWRNQEALTFASLHPSTLISILTFLYPSSHPYSYYPFVQPVPCIHLSSPPSLPSPPPTRLAPIADPSSRRLSIEPFTLHALPSPTASSGQQLSHSHSPTLAGHLSDPWPSPGPIRLPRGPSKSPSQAIQNPIRARDLGLLRGNPRRLPPPGPRPQALVAKDRNWHIPVAHYSITSTPPFPGPAQVHSHSLSHCSLLSHTHTRFPSGPGLSPQAQSLALSLVLVQVATVLFRRYGSLHV